MVYSTVLLFVLGGCAAWFVGDDPEARRALARKWTDDAIELLRKNKVEDAKEKLINAVELSPDFAEARDALGILYIVEGNYDEAKNQFDWAVAAQPDVSLFQYHLSIAHILKGGVGFAAPSLNRALELDPENIGIKRTLLDVYISLGRWDRAERLQAELKATKIEDDTLIYTDGLIAFAKEDLGRAKARFEQASKILLKDPAPPAALGLMYETIGFLDKAEAAYKEALERAPNDMDANLVIADFYHKSGRYTAAETHLRKTLRVAPQQLSNKEKALVYFQIADVNYQTGDYKTSELFKQRSIKLLPELKNSEIGIDAAAHFALGAVEYERGNVDAAIREFKLAVKGNPKFTLGWVKLADSLLLKAGLSPIGERMELLKNARKAAQRAQELAPKHALGYYLEGKILLATADLQEGAFRGGSLREAVFAFQQARNAGDPPADIGIYQAVILSDLASHVEAAAALKDTQKRIPDKFELVFLRATELVKAEKYTEARVALSEAYNINKNNDDLGSAMSLVLFKLGDINGALKAMAWKPDQGPLPGALPLEAIQMQQALAATEATTGKPQTTLPAAKAAPVQPPKKPATTANSKKP